MATRSCYLCEKEIEVDEDELEDTLTIEINGKEITEDIESCYRDKEGNEVFLCDGCNERVKEQIEKMRKSR